MSSKIKNALRFIQKINLYKTFRFNFHYFRFHEAIRIPVIVFKGVEFYSLRGRLSENPNLG